MGEEKTLTPAELLHLQNFVQDVLETINYDDTGVTDDLIEGAETAAEILGIRRWTKVEDDDDVDDTVSE